VAERQGGGPARVEQALAARGLDPKLVAAVAAEAFAEAGEPAAAVAAGRRRLAALRDVAPAVARRRLAGYLSRRGYQAEAIAHALQALLGRAGDEPEEH
jgi:regulatory protein